MREILFKAKRKDNGEWVEGFIFEFKGKFYIMKMTQTFMTAYYSEESVVDFNMRAVEIDPDTLCQYIGKTDKKNRKIFENDIVKDGKWLGKIVCRDSNFEMDLFKYSKVTGKYFAVFTRSCFEVEEVIGNIFDNPELLEVGV